MEIDIGKHCNLKECNQLDFLPFKCNKCNLYFCLEHMSPELHNCKFLDSNIIKCNKVSANKTKQVDKCFYKKCKKNIIHNCKFCQKNFCVIHRLQEVHNCKDICKKNLSIESQIRNEKNNILISDNKHFLNTNQVEKKTNKQNINQVEEKTNKNKKKFNCCIIC